MTLWPKLCRASVEQRCPCRNGECCCRLRHRQKSAISPPTEPNRIVANLPDRMADSFAMANFQHQTQPTMRKKRVSTKIVLIPPEKRVQIRSVADLPALTLHRLVVAGHIRFHKPQNGAPAHFDRADLAKVNALFSALRGKPARPGKNQRKRSKHTTG